MTDTLAHRLDRTLVIGARPETVFSFFTETARWAAWWGQGSSIDTRPGGAVVIRHLGGVEASGEVLEVRSPERLVFTYGYADRPPSPPGSTRVTIRLDRHPRGTLLQLTHQFADEAAREEHIQGWRFQLSVFANLIANTVNAGAVVAAVDGWFDAWNEPDEARRRERLQAIAAADVRFRDRFSCIDGLDDLVAHLGAFHRFMPGQRIARRGEPQHCQWRVLASWVATGKDGQDVGTGTNVFELDVDGKIVSVTGFWG